MAARDLERSVYRRPNKNAGTPNAETQAGLRLLSNERPRHLLRESRQLRDDTLTFDSVTDEPQYALPEQGIARILRMWDTTNRRYLEQQPLSWLRQVDPEPNTGTPCYW